MRAVGVISGVFLVVAALLTRPTAAATVRGTITLPPEAPDPRDSQWRVENGILPIGPRQPDPRADVIVVLEGQSTKAGGKDAAAPSTVQIELHGLRLDPRVVAVPVGTSVEFKNSDRVPHTLYIERATAVMPPTPTPSGKSRTQKFEVAGEYRIRDEEYPHIQGAVVAVRSPYFTRLDERGAFRLDVPEGKYALKVFYRTAWVVSQSVEVGAHTTDVAVQVPAAQTAPGGAKR
jgi:plastocyanin